MYSDDDTRCRVGCPIRISTDQRLLAAPRGFSQRATSFIASWCQGIHRMPFLYSISRSRPEGRDLTMHRNHPQVATLVLANVAEEWSLEILVFSATQHDPPGRPFLPIACAITEKDPSARIVHRASEPSLSNLWGV